MPSVSASIVLNNALPLECSIVSPGVLASCAKKLDNRVESPLRLFIGDETPNEHPPHETCTRNRRILPNNDCADAGHSRMTKLGLVASATEAQQQREKLCLRFDAQGAAQNTISQVEAPTCRAWTLRADSQPIPLLFGGAHLSHGLGVRCLGYTVVDGLDST